jgi:amino-acid N-acetyltransferase
MHNYPGHSVEEHGTESELPDSFVIRPAQLSDVPAMLHVINDYASQAVMLPRTELELCEHMRDFMVAVDTSIEGDPLVACGALQFYTQHIAEVRSLAVVPERARSGLGKRITEELLEEARRHGVDVVFAFTYVPGFFGKLGFKPVDRGALPLKAWKDCLRCPKFSACDEIAVAYMITPGAEIYMSAMPPEEAPVEGEILFPILGTPRILDEKQELPEARKTPRQNR